MNVSWCSGDLTSGYKRPRTGPHGWHPLENVSVSIRKLAKGSVVTGNFGVRPDGRWKAPYMTDGELIRELAAENDRRAELEAELRERRVAREALRGRLSDVVPIGNRGTATEMPGSVLR